MSSTDSQAFIFGKNLGAKLGDTDLTNTNAEENPVVRPTDEQN